MWKRLLGSLLPLVAGASLASASDLYGDASAPIMPWYIERILPYQTWCGYPQSFWLSAEFQTVVMKDGNLPTLVTGGPAGTQGILGQPGTVLLYGDDKANLNPFLGGKFMGGLWNDYNELYGIEGGFSYASERSGDFFAYPPATPDAPVIARLGTGFLGAEGHLIRNWKCLEAGRIDLIAGFRYLELDETLMAGFRAVITDDFDARTRFYGGYVGAKAKFHRDAWTLDGLGRVALGGTQEEIGIDRGGLLTLPTNAGVRQKDVFGVVPELSVRIGCQVLERLNVFAGFSVLYWNRVIRVGDQVDRTTNPDLPNVSFNSTDFWLVTTSVGLEVRY